MNPPRRFSSPTISLKELAANYGQHNRSFAEFLDGKREARRASQFPPPSEKPWPICPVCRLDVKPNDDADVDDGDWVHTLCSPRRIA